MDSYLRRVSQRLTGLASKRSGFALGVCAPPGIGKTHAVLALLRGAQCRLLTVHATQPLEGTLLQLPRPKKLSAWLERGLERLRGGEALASEALLQTDPIEATRVGRLLCKADPYDLETVRLTLFGLRISGNHRSLSRVYEAARGSRRLVKPCPQLGRIFWGWGKPHL